MLICYFSGRLRNFPLLAQNITFRDIMKATVSAMPALAMPAFIVVLLRTGIATPDRGERRCSCLRHSRQHADFTET